MFLETTKIAAERTCGEIQSLLCASGAEAVMNEFKDGRVAAVSFRLSVNGDDLHFRLPCRWENVRDCVTRKTRELADEFDERCRRIAWRQIYRWLQAQLALLQTNMVKAHEIFLPYLVDHKGHTLFERMNEIQVLLEDKR